MAGIMDILNISYGALKTTTRQLDVVSHNVSNANTPGYTRQEGLQSTASPESTPSGNFGKGVQLDTIIQKVDALLQKRINEKKTDEVFYNTYHSMLSRLESMANEVKSSGLGSEITKFFSAWQDLSNNPQSTAVREALEQSANNLVERFNNAFEDFRDVQRDTNTYIAGAVADFNSLAKRVADLNKKIVAQETGGHSANDLRDERQVLLDKMAGLMNITYFEDASGAVTVQAGEGMTVVQGTYPATGDSGPLHFSPKKGSEFNVITWRDSELEMDSSVITGGKIGAWLKVRDKDIPETLEFFNNLAKTMIGEVNKLHSSGAGTELFTETSGSYVIEDSSKSFNDADNKMDFANLVKQGSFKIWVYESGTSRSYDIAVGPNDSVDDVVARINSTLNRPSDPNALVTSDGKVKISALNGVKFGFADDSSGFLAAVGINNFFQGASASSIKISDTIKKNANMICAGKIAADGKHTIGDNSIALKLANLKDSDVMTNGTETLNESVISWSANLGTKVSNAKNSKDFASTTNNELQDLRDDVSGVSIDEEMVKMIKFQRGYQMAAQMINVADEMLQTLLRIKG